MNQYFWVELAYWGTDWSAGGDRGLWECGHVSAVTTPVPPQVLMDRHGSIPLPFGFYI